MMISPPITKQMIASAQYLIVRTAFTTSGVIPCALRASASILNIRVRAMKKGIEPA